MLERAGVVQSFTVGVAPIVVVISSVCTFTLHMAMGYDLTAAEVFKYGRVRVPHFSYMIYQHSTGGNGRAKHFCASHWVHETFKLLRHVPGLV